MSFSENGYQIIRNFLTDDFVDFIQEYFFLRVNAGHAIHGDSQAINGYSFYGDPLMETVLQSSCDSLSKIVGLKLVPTYSYTRLYAKGDELVNHRDRPSCEVSATIALGLPKGEKTSPIFFSRKSDKTEAVEIHLNPGDMCLYRGCDLYHWREPFTHKWYLQSFIHYVDSDGPNASWIYDKRGCLGEYKE